MLTPPPLLKEDDYKTGTTRTVQVGRKYSEWRISAYECRLNSSGDVLKRGRYVIGWYGLFDIHRLKSEIMPKLAEYAAQGWSYPFLVTSHRLRSKTMVKITPPKDVKYYRRRPDSRQTWHAVVLSTSKYKDITK